MPGRELIDRARRGRTRGAGPLDANIGAVTKTVCVRGLHGDASTPTASGEGSSQHTRCRRPHLRHSYWTCEGHISSVCINLHHRFAICAGVGFIDQYSLSGRVIAALAFTLRMLQSVRFFIGLLFGFCFRQSITLLSSPHCRLLPEASWGPTNLPVARLPPLS